MNSPPGGKVPRAQPKTTKPPHTSECTARPHRPTTAKGRRSANRRDLQSWPENALVPRRQKLTTEYRNQLIPDGRHRHRSHLQHPANAPPQPANSYLKCCGRERDQNAETDSVALTPALTKGREPSHPDHDGCVVTRAGCRRGGPTAASSVATSWSCSGSAANSSLADRFEIHGVTVAGKCAMPWGEPSQPAVAPGPRLVRRGGWPSRPRGLCKPPSTAVRPLRGVLRGAPGLPRWPLLRPVGRLACRGTSMMLSGRCGRW